MWTGWHLRWFGNRGWLRDIDTIILGLGNPGKQYENTRHNIGFMVVDALGGSLARKQAGFACRSRMATGRLEDTSRVLLAKPQTYMNRSGMALRAIIDRTGVQPSSCLVVVDDFNLPLGTLRFRRGGSDGGHNGLKSIVENVGKEFSRLRIGIGPLPAGVSPFDFVLGAFAPDESDAVERTVEEAVRAIGYCAANGIEAAMNRHNR